MMIRMQNFHPNYFAAIVRTHIFCLHRIAMSNYNKIIL